MTSPMQERHDRFSLDTDLRKAGFKIHARIKEQQPVWERDGAKFLQSQAISIMNREKRENGA